VERSGHWRRLAGGEELECLGSGAGRRDVAVQAGETEQSQDMWLVAGHVQAGSVPDPRITAHDQRSALPADPGDELIEDRGSVALPAAIIPQRTGTPRPRQATPHDLQSDDASARGGPRESLDTSPHGGKRERS
jgi:hypothetical protein